MEKGIFWTLVQIFNKDRRDGIFLEWGSITYGIFELVLGNQKE